jgi:hypothetical protein
MAAARLQTPHPTGPQENPESTSLSDLLTALKNVVTALANATLAYRQVNGISTAEAIIAPRIVKATAGRVASISVIVAGSTPGVIYDASQIGIITGPICGIPNTLGVTFINLPTDTGIVVVPGTGQTVTVSWS